VRTEHTVPPITLAQNIAFGNALKDQYDLLSDVIATAPEVVYPHSLTSKRRPESETARLRTVRIAQKARHTLHSLQYELEQELFKQIPRSKDPRGLAFYVYMGDERIVPWELFPYANDAFKGWRLEANPRHVKAGGTE
jgi:hypothetical protein